MDRAMINELSRCKHGLLPGQCSFCNGQVTAQNQTRYYGNSDAVFAKNYPMAKGKDKMEKCILCRTREARSRGLCQKCYNNWRKGFFEHPALGPYQGLVDNEREILNTHIKEQKMAEKKEEKEIMVERIYPGKVEALPPEVGTELKPTSIILEISLEDYPEVMESLKEAAKTNIRSIEHQALYYIVKCLKEEIKE